RATPDPENAVASGTRDCDPSGTAPDMPWREPSPTRNDAASRGRIRSHLPDIGDSMLSFAKPAAAALAIGLVLAGCGNTRGERTATGALIGAGGGALVGSAVSGTSGAVVGGVAGAAGGAIVGSQM